jgi:hypothetical protein
MPFSFTPGGRAFWTDQVDPTEKIQQGRPEKLSQKIDAVSEPEPSGAMGQLMRILARANIIVNVHFADRVDVAEEIRKARAQIPKALPAGKVKAPERKVFQSAWMNSGRNRMFEASHRAAQASYAHGAGAKVVYVDDGSAATESQVRRQQEQDRNVRDRQKYLGVDVE